jgi:hypothetical protein
VQGEAQRNSGAKSRGQQFSCGRVWTKEDEKNVKGQFARTKIGLCGVVTSKRRSHAQRVRTGRESCLPGKSEKVSKKQEHEAARTEDEAENDAPDD